MWSYFTVPTGLRSDSVTASDITDSTITLTWTPPSDTSSGVSIRYSPDSGLSQNPVIVDEPVTSYTLEGLDSDTQYTITLSTFSSRSDITDLWPCRAQDSITDSPVEVTVNTGKVYKM